jgi:hypothetical protein
MNNRPAYDSVAKGPRGAERRTAWKKVLGAKIAKVKTTQYFDVLAR